MSSSSASPPASVPAPTSFTPFYNNPGSPTVRFNPTMAIVIIVLIGGCFVFGFVSVFVRRCMSGDTAETMNTTARSPNSTAKSRGLDKAAVEALPVVHSSDLNEKDDRECPVCLTDFEPEDSLRLLPTCNHVFHQECIDAWFDEHSTCPLCRASLTGIASNTSGEPGPLQDSAVASVPEVPESGDSDIELQRTTDAAPCEDSTQDADTAPIVATTPGVATMSREDSRNSARGMLSRNSQSFKRAARGSTALERAHSLGAQFSKPPVTPIANSRKRPLTPAASTTTGIRRSTSLGTDIVALRKLLLGGDQQGNASSIASRRLTGVAMADAPPSRSSWFSRARSMNLSSRGRSLPRTQSTDNWVGVDLEFGKLTPPAEPSSSQIESSSGPERTRSGGWSLAGLRGAMIRSTSDAYARTNNSHLPL